MQREASIVCVSGVSRCCNMDFFNWLYRPLHPHVGAKTFHTFCNLCVPDMNLKDTTSVGDLEAKGPWSCRPAPVKKGREKMAGGHIGFIFIDFISFLCALRLSDSLSERKECSLPFFHAPADHSAPSQAYLFQSLWRCKIITSFCKVLFNYSFSHGLCDK